MYVYYLLYEWNKKKSDMIEIWKDIDGCPGYQVSNTGKVKSLERKVKDKNGSIRTIKERIIKPGKNTGGYLIVVLRKEGKNKTMKVHRLVAKAFIQNDSLFKNDINHLDEDKTNNNVNNLEWCTREYNINYGTHNERMAVSNSKAHTGVYNTKKSKPVKCLETGLIFPSIMEVQRQLGFNNSSISACCKGKLNTCGGFHWKYVD